MRTTIEISEKHRNILLGVAAQTGLRGHSGIMNRNPISKVLSTFLRHRVKALLRLSA